MQAAIGDLFEMTTPAASQEAEAAPKRGQVAQVSPGAVATGFDYSALPADIAKEARASAGRIVASQERHVAMVVEAGRDLARIKDSLDHGQWLPWLEQECRIDARTAQRYMSTAEEFGDKYVTVSHLPLATVYALAAAPEKVRAEVVKSSEAGTPMAGDDVRHAIRQAKRAATEAARLAKMKPAAQRAKATREKTLKQQWQEQQVRQGQEEADQWAAATSLAEMLAVSLPSTKWDSALALLEQAGHRIDRALRCALDPSYAEEHEAWQKRLAAERRS